MGVQPAIFGGIPSRGVDIPICAVFIACFLAIGATHMTIFQKNRRRGHKFVPSALCFGFSMARVATFTMRIVWATRPTNQNVTIAANALVAAGVILLVSSCDIRINISNSIVVHQSRLRNEAAR